MTLKEMREKQRKLLADARAKLAEISDTTTAEQAAAIETAHDAIMAEHDALAQRADRLQAVEEREGRLPAVETPPAAAASTEDRGTVVPLTADVGLTLIDEAREYGVEDEVRTLVKAKGATEASVRAAMVKAAADKQRENVGAAGGVSAVITRDETGTQREAVIGALVARMTRAAPDERSRAFMGLSIAEVIAQRMGFNSRDPMAIIQRAMHTTSDFPLLLEAAANKVLLGAYQVAIPTYRAIAAQKSFNDFKPHKFLRVGDFPALQDVNEAGEIKSGTFGENREQTQLSTKGIIVSLSRQAIVNDDLSAFSDLTRGAGLEAARTENSMFYTLLNSNAVLSDNVAMFHATHGNLAASGALPSVSTLSAARAAMRKQRGIGKKAGAPGTQPLNIAPVIILSGPDIETSIQQILSPIQAQQAGNVNPFANGSIKTQVTDAMITGDEWYMFADPAVVPNFIYGYLRDASGPMLMQNTPFNTDGVSLRVLHDFAVGQVDYRGGYKNPGAAPS